MRRAGIIAVTLAILTSALVWVGCGGGGGMITEATGWVTVVEDVKPEPYSSGISLRTTQPFDLTGAPCRLRYETMRALALRVYIVPEDDPAKRQGILDQSRSPENGETTLNVEPGTYYLELEGVSDCFRWHLWLEEQR